MRHHGAGLSIPNSTNEFKDVPPIPGATRTWEFVLREQRKFLP
jgi:hypothetical protein